MTINNPTADDFHALDEARSCGWKIEGQVERGQNGTDHLQLCVRTPQVRFARMKKAFPRAHIEIARNVTALRQYVAKEETKVADLPAQDNKYPSLSKMWEMIFELFHTHDKSGWNDVALWEGRIELYYDKDQRFYKSDPLAWFGEAVARLILKGYYVEHHACNPSVRSQWKNFHDEILIRAYNNILAREKAVENMQTDRQTDSVQSLEIPVLQESITNADANKGEEGGLQEAGGITPSEESVSYSEGEGSSTFGSDSSCSESDC